MESTFCYPCSDSFKQTRKIQLFGKEVTVKNYICSRDGEPYREKPEKIQLQLSVSPNAYCSANCPFCIAKAPKNKDRIDLVQFEKVLLELKKEDVVRGVSFTGGEPLTDVGFLNEVINMVYDTFGLKMEVSVSSNGTNFDQLKRIEKLSYLDQFHLSRHHYDDKINEKLFGTKVIGGEEIKRVVESISFPDVFVMNCLLMKDYIGSREEAHKLMDFAKYVGIPKVSFITASPVNDFVKNQQVNYEDVISAEDESLLLTRSYQDFDICKCQDGIYVLKDGSLEEFYGRCTHTGGCSYTRSFSYGSDNHLRCNYDGEILI